MACLTAVRVAMLLDGRWWWFSVSMACLAAVRVAMLLDGRWWCSVSVSMAWFVAV